MSLSHRTRTATATSLSSNSGAPSTSRSLSESLLGESEPYARPPSPGLPLHRETAMSNLELHESGTASQRRRGIGGASNGGPGTTPYGANGGYEDVQDEKDYLLDRSDKELDTRRRDNGKEKEKWSKLIPEDLLGGRAHAKQPARQRRSGLFGVVRGSRLDLRISTSILMIIQRGDAVHAILPL